MNHVHQDLARTLSHMLWVSDYIPGIGDQGYFVTDPREAASVILEVFDVYPKKALTDKDRIEVLTEMLAETSDEDEDYWDREALEHRIAELRKRGKND